MNHYEYLKENDKKGICRERTWAVSMQRFALPKCFQEHPYDAILYPDSVFSSTLL